MNQILPVHLRAKGAAVATLHAGLLFLIRNQSGISDNDRRTLEQGLAPELRDQVYGDWTTKLVSIWQEQLADRFQLTANGDVDQATANALNKLLAELGATDSDPPPQSQYRVYGTIRDNLHRPLVGAPVAAFDKDIRREQRLGKPATTNKSGGYAIDYTRDQFSNSDKDAADLIVRVYDANNKLLKESSTVFNAAHELRVDLDLSQRSYSGLSEFEVALAAIRPVVGELPLSQLTDDAKYRDISFLVSKTGLPQATVEALAMAYRFESDTKIEAAACYGLIRSGPTSHPIVTPAANAAAADFAARCTQTFGALMRQDIDTLMTGLQNAIDSNTIPYEVSDHLPLIRRQLVDQQQRYLKQTGGSTAPPELAMKLSIAGLKGEQVSSFVDLFSKLGDANAELWGTLKKNPKFQEQKTDLLQAVFSLSRLTGEQMVLTDSLITTQKIGKPDDLTALAAHSSQDWLKILNDNKIDPPAGIAGQDGAARAQNYATVLEQTFTKAFPSAAFAARIQSDRSSRIPNASSVANFLAVNPQFDLLTSRIGQFVAGKAGVAAADAGMVQTLRRTQRIFRHTASYGATNLLLGDGIDSSQKIYRMGQANFTRKYGPSLGEAEAKRIYQKAGRTHAQALTLVGNLKSMSDASYLEVFPNYTTIISAAMQAEVPDLDALFGQTDFCECDECRSVYGAAAYLTDILHFLENRVTSVNCAPNKKASVEEALLRRRPDIADIDLECNNTNTEVPYIDIVNELLEDVIAPPEVTVAATFLPKFVSGTIDPGLQTGIVSQFQSGGQPNVAALLTGKAKLSDKYSAERLQDNDTCVVEDHWIIRDQFVVLKATDRGAAGIAVRLLHETLLDADEISANPEYVNVKAYDALKTAERPFSLPFDLFEAEGEAYLEKLGTKKPDLIDAFRREHYPPGPPPTPADLDMAYAYLKIDAAERTLIFQPDPSNQAAYWGPLASGADAELDLFMTATGLEYEQVLQLLKLKSINPAHDSVISSDDLSCDTDKKHVTNLTSKYDTIHRFLRLWKKTGLTLEELDAIVQSPALGGGAIQPPLAWQLHRFLELTKLWSLSAFQLLAFYGDIDTGSSDDLYEQLFQDRAATNPLNPDFSIVAVTSGAPIAITDVHRGIISGALGTAPDDLAVLIAGTDGKLTLANLSAFYRMTQLSQALSVSIAELLVLIDLINVAPFTDPATTTTFYSGWRTVISSQFAAGELDYVLREQGSATDSPIASDDLIAAALADLQGKLLQTEAATAVKDDPKGELLRKWLADPVLNWNSRLVDRLMEILATQDDDEYKNRIDASHEFLLNLRIQYQDAMLTADLSALPSGVVLPDSVTTSFAVQISYDDVNRRLVLVGYMSAADQVALIALAPIADPAFPEYKTAIDQLFAAQQTISNSGNIFFADISHINTDLEALLSNQLPDRYKLFLTKIVPIYLPLQQRSVVQKEICSWFKVNKDIAAAMTDSQPAINVSLTDPDFVHKTDPLAAANYGAQFDWYRRMAKICFIVGKLKLTADDLSWFLANATSINALDFWSLPVAPVGGPVTTFASFEVVINVLGFEQRYAAVKRVTAAATSTVSVYSILDQAIAAASTAIIEADLCSLTGWDQGQLDQLINAPNYFNLAPIPSSDLKDIRILRRLDRCFAIMKSLGATAGDCVAWSKPSLSFDDALKIKLALKAQTGDDEWLGLTQPLQNTLREAKRDALIAYLLANPPAGRTWQDADDLYGYFLIDVEMCSCQPTSRIVQATNSVQQFVQRCFLNLEKIVTVDLTLDPDWSQWQWMKNFRLWQANRKVFLYPENWIEPELLPSEIKSPFFKDLESDLLQNEVTTASAETAFLKYLDQLEGVSRLEIKAMWYEDGKRTLHVVGRTYGGDPKIYYYRKFVDNRRWTPWIKIDQDVTSDHIVLTVFNHRVYLFWAVFTEQSRDVDSVKVPPVPGSGGGTFIPDKPKKYWQIQLAFSEYKNGKWTPKKISNADETGALFVDQSWDGKAYWPDKRIFLFTPLDIPALDPRKYFDSTGKPNNPETLLSDIRTDSISGLQSNGDLRINCYITGDGYMYQGTFDLDPCKGYPVVIYGNQLLSVTLFDHSNFVNMLETEQDNPTDALAVHGAAIVQQTPGTFANLASLQMGIIDRLIYIMNRILYEFAPRWNEMTRRTPVTVGTFMPFFYQDRSYTYFAQPEISDNAGFEFAYQDIEDLLLAVLEGNTNKANEIMARFPRYRPTGLLIHFYNFYHPLVCAFIRILFDKGIDALMARDTQLIGDVIYDKRPDKFDFDKVLQPTAAVYSGQPVTYPLPSGSVTDPHPGYPKADVDFDIKGGYSAYNWELFFHAPLMIAERLSRNQQFEDADHWFRYIFNPTDASQYPAPDKYWVTKPFFINVNDKYTQQNIENVMLGINSNIQSLVNDVTDWRNNPFQPHYIAQYRTVAYQKTAVMKYLDHLIAWGDSLFRQDTMESVAEATQIYVLAQQILGPQPKIIPPSYELPVDNYGQLQQKLDAFSNALVDIENVLPLQEIVGDDNITRGVALPSLDTLYFCIPPNDKLMGYWATVGQRLYNIRHCLNIEGKYAPLALFAPPIDPGLLVRAAAAGLDIGSILSDMNAPLPNYRFSVVVQKAVELCNEVKSLGSALLQAMEKKDAEDLALLRSRDGLSVLKAALEVRNQQVQEANHNLEALQQQQILVQARIDHFQGLLSAGLNSWETSSLNLTQLAIGGEQQAVAIELLVNVLALIPDLEIGGSGFGGTPTVTGQFGGAQLAGAMRALAGAIRGTAGIMHSQAGVSSTQATYERRKEDWQHQVTLGKDEMQQVQKQILAATVRQAIANKEVENQQLQIDNSQAEDDFMHSKFTNNDLYAWMIGQISTIYFQSFQLAYGLAKQAEQTFRYELALGDSSFIQFGYWDSLKKGLLSADQLSYDIRRMDKAYHDQNAREYELTKHISLAQLDPSALLLLKTKGQCWINVPEEIYDMDYPGHYLRRIKSVALSIPCVAGPYTSVSCTLTMTKNSMRVGSIGGGANNYPRKKLANGTPADDPRFRDAVGAIQSIAISSAQNDAGLFELNFRDERYLPFEGAGGISQWHLQLPAPYPQFDYSTISDVIMHVKYTARDGGEQLRGDATASLKAKINAMLVSLKDTGLMRAFSARHEFPTEWYAFLNPPAASSDQTLTLNIDRDRFPYFASMGTIKIKHVELVADTALASIPLIQVVPAPTTPPPPLNISDGYYAPMLRLMLDYAAKAPGTWTITNPHTNPRLTSDKVNDLIVIVHYEVS